MVVGVFEQKTADELRISDWSSDVCSSDRVRGIDVDLFIGVGVDVEARREPADDFAAAVVRGADEELVVFIEDRGVDLRLRAADERRLADRFAVERDVGDRRVVIRSEEHTSELQSLMRISYAVLCLKKKNK